MRVTLDCCQQKHREEDKRFLFHNDSVALNSTPIVFNSCEVNVIRRQTPPYRRVGWTFSNELVGAALCTTCESRQLE